MKAYPVTPESMSSTAKPVGPRRRAQFHWGPVNSRRSSVRGSVISFHGTTGTFPRQGTTGSSERIECGLESRYDLLVTRSSFVPPPGSRVPERAGLFDFMLGRVGGEGQFALSCPSDFLNLGPIWYRLSDTPSKGKVGAEKKNPLSPFPEGRGKMNRPISAHFLNHQAMYSTCVE